MTVLWLVVGCDRAPVVVPESPPDAVQTVVAGLTDNQPQVLWDALPPSYQADIRSLLKTFCDHMDADLYDRTFRMLSKAAVVLRKKKDYLFNSPMTLDNPVFETGLGLHWERTVGVLETLIQSDLSSLESLRRMDPGEFLATTGSSFMSDLEDLTNRTQRSPNRNPWERARKAMEEAQIGFVKGTNQTGYLTLGAPDPDSVKEVKMTQVEGRWVPSEMAASWNVRVAEAREGMRKLSGPEFEKAKPTLFMILGGLEGAMDALLQAGSQKEFDDTLKSLSVIAGLARSLAPAPEPPNSEAPE